MVRCGMLSARNKEGASGTERNLQRILGVLSECAGRRFESDLRLQVSLSVGEDGVGYPN